MSVLISCRNGKDWFKANWVFRQLAADVLTLYPDEDLGACLVQAEALNHLNLAALEESLSTRLTAAPRRTALDTVSGAIKGWRPDDAKEHRLYVEAVSELLALLDSPAR